MLLSHGALVATYRILAPLGAGGMGEVYRAHDEKLNRDVALKILSAELASNAEHLRRFQQEAHAASALNHPNIITIYDIGRVDETAYIAMELVEGQDLRSMQAAGRLPLKNVLRIAVKVADGLAATHERGIVHRDLKPENVMISRDGFVKILDFGLAKLARAFTETESTAPHTSPGAVFGTVAYMSPEQAAGRVLDFRSDQFTLGVILYEMLTGRAPFNEATAAETLAAIIRRDPAPASSLNEAVTPELQRILDRCLAKDPAERYAATRDLARDLREIRDRISHPSEPRHGSDRPPVRSAQRVPLFVGTAAVAILLIAIAAVMTLRHRPSVQNGPHSLAILPFHDLTETPEGQIFTDIVAETIRSRLGEVVRVIPAIGSDSRANAMDVARRLGTAYALTGAVERKGDVVHVRVSLIDAGTGQEVAGEALKAPTSGIAGLNYRAVDVILSGMNVQHEKHERSIPSELTSAMDRSAYDETEGLLQRAQDQKSVERAIETLEGLLRNARDSAPVNAQYARALLYKAQLRRQPDLIAQATVYAERAAELDDSSPEIHVRLGQVRNAAGRYAEAEGEFRRALTLRNDYADAYLGLAETSEAMGRAGDAEAMYKKVIALRPNHAASYNRYAVFLIYAGRHEEAAANFLKFTQLNPTPRGFSNLGAAYQALGRYGDARRAYERSIALEPTSDAYVNLATVYYYSGYYADAVRAGEKATSLAPASYVAWLVLGDAYRQSPDLRQKSIAAYEATVKASRGAVGVNPRDALAYGTLANALAKLGKIGDAATSLQTALKLEPTNPNVLYDAAVVELLRGNAAVAIGWLQRAVRSGYPLDDLRGDPEFKSVHSDAGFPRPVA